MIRVSEFQGLTKEKLLKINQIYDKSEMIKGKMSSRYLGHDIKNNTEISHEQTRHQVQIKHRKNQVVL